MPALMGWDCRRSRIPLVKKDGTFSGVHGDVFLQRRATVIDECYNGRVKVVFDGKHVFQTTVDETLCKRDIAGVLRVLVV